MSSRKLNCETSRTLILYLMIMCTVAHLLPLLPVSAETPTENDFMDLLNAERITLGKSPLSINSNLSTAAYLHSKDMAEQGYFSHTSPNGTTFWQRIVAAGYTDYVSLAENIAYASGLPDAAKVYDIWKNSPGHYANMMGDFTDAGLGVYSKNGSTYYTLDLGKSRTPQIPEFPNPMALLVFFLFVAAVALISRSLELRQKYYQS